jgi:predicted Zn-dependent protease
MKTKHILLLMIAVFCIKSSYSQDRISKDEMQRALIAYRRAEKTFTNLDICGSRLEGPIFLVKRTENYSLDRVMPITQQQQADIGYKIFQQSEAASVVNDPKATKMLRDMVARLRAVSSQPNADYHAYLVQSDEVNAFSTIGGYIYVTTGLLNFVETKDELAFVLGHEMSHIMLKHVVRKEKKIALIMYAENKLNFQRFSQVAENMNTTLSAPFDQIDEYEADHSGLRLVQKAGYDPTAFNLLFTKFAKYEKTDRISRYTSNHPPSESRRRCLNDVLANQK